MNLLAKWKRKYEPLYIIKDLTEALAELERRINEKTEKKESKCQHRRLAECNYYGGYVTASDDIKVIIKKIIGDWK